MADPFEEQLKAAYQDYLNGQLQLAKDRFSQIELPTYQQVTLPTSETNLTGMLPGNNPGGFGGLPGASFLDTNVDAMGQIGGGVGSGVDYTMDPRLAAMGYAPGQKTLGGRTLDLAGDTERAREDLANRTLAANQSNADRNFAESQRQAIQAQTNQDLKDSAEYGVPVINGQQVPAWMAPHVEWARQIAQGNGGKLPTYNDLVAQLGSIGERPEDYNGGKPYPGTLPTAAPGVLVDPAHGGYLDVASGKAMTSQEVAEVGRNRAAQAPQITGRDPATGQPIYGTGMPTMASQQGGATLQDQAAGVAEAGTMFLSRPSGPTLQGGGTVYTGPDPVGAAPAAPTLARPPTVDLQGSGATAAIGAGTPTSQAQRGLIEQGREADINAQTSANAQAIQREQNLMQNAIAQGQLDVARQHEANITNLQQQQIDLQKQGQAAQQAIAAGNLTGSYTDANGNTVDTLAKQQGAQNLAEQQRQFDATQSGTLVDANGNPVDTLAKGGLMGNLNGQATLAAQQATGKVNGQDTTEAGALMGVFNGNSTLAGQEAYGGSSQVNSGLTLAAQEALGRVAGQDTLAKQAQDANTAIQAANTMGVRSADDVFQSIARARSMEGTSVPALYNAFQSTRGVPSFGSFTMDQPQQATTLRRPPGAPGGGTMGVVNQTSAGPVVGRVQAGDPQAFATMRRPAAAGAGAGQPASPEDWLTPKAGSTSASMGVTLARPDRVPLRNYQNMSDTERGALASAYSDQNPGMTRADLEGAIQRGAPQFQGARATRFA